MGLGAKRKFGPFFDSFWLLTAGFWLFSIYLMPQSSKNHQAGFAAILVLAVMAVLIAGGFGLIKLKGDQTGPLDQNPTITPPITLKKNITPRACTLEAKICPDGSSVSRVAPDCNFAPCSSGATPTVSSKITPGQALPGAITDNSLESDLKALENAGSAIDGGMGGIDQSLNDKPDNLTE